MVIIFTVMFHNMIDIMVLIAMVIVVMVFIVMMIVIMIVKMVVVVMAFMVVVVFIIMPMMEMCPIITMIKIPIPKMFYNTIRTLFPTMVVPRPPIVTKSPIIMVPIFGMMTINMMVVVLTY